MAENLLSFTIKSGLKNIIGRDLITDDYVAVFELVKNAYDARASQVTIEFLEDKIIITDNGKGMSKEDIEKKWLAVAYSAKKEGIEDADENPDYRANIQLKRFYAGAKGIGRFSCDKLGNKLTLTTRKEGKEPAEQIKLNWKEFEQNANKEFIDIKVKHETKYGEHVFANDSKYGTRLVITELNEVWSREKKKGLKRSLAKLINPFDSENTKYAENANQTFSISIIDKSEKEADSTAKEDYDVVNGEVKNFIFEKLDLKTSHITVKIDTEGKGITIKLVDRGTLIYKIRKPNNTLLKNIVFHLFFLNQAAKTNFTKTVGTRPIDFGSIYLYKNGFRIAPYGDPGDDSFKIERRHGQAVGRTFGLRDLVGRIEIFGDEQNLFFKETTSREGFVKNEYTEALGECFFDFCLRKLEDYVFNIARKTTEADDKNQEDTSHLENLKSQNEIFKLIRKEVEKDGGSELEELDRNFMTIKAQALGAATKEAIDNLNFLAERYGDTSFLDYTKHTATEFERLKAEKEELAHRLQAEEIEMLKVEEERRKLEKELREEKDKNTYLLATRRTLSDDADGLIHNIKFTSDMIQTIVGNLTIKIREGVFDQKEVLEELEKIKILAGKALKISELITRANFKTKADIQIVDVVKYWEQYTNFYNEIYDDQRIQFEFLTNGASFEIRAGVLDLSIVFDNFIFNSSKAGASKVRVECQNPDSNSLSITFSDNGKGLAQYFLDAPDKIFELGVTTTEGSGIGMSTVQKILKDMNATVRFIGNGQYLSGATFEILFQ
jgi:signal transduction histidine kinase